MTKEEYRNAQDEIIYLVTCAINDTVPQRSRVEAMDLHSLYKAAGRHLLTAATAFALESAGISDPSFTQAKAASMRRTALMDAEMASVFAKMEEAGIWYMPLKGTILKDFYPQFGMREMADRDILFDAERAEDVRAIMESMRFTTEHFGAGNHDVYFKPPVFNFEMHRALFSPGVEESLYDYYRDAEHRLTGSGCQKHLAPEDFYLYITAHEYKHYSSGGTGLRSVADTFVCLRRTCLDMDYVETEAKKLGIADFEKRSRSLALHLFSEMELTEADREMLEYILSSGTYGTISHRVENQMKKNGWGRIRYMLHRFSVPVSRKDRRYSSFAGVYPLFYRYKILLPALPFYRTLRSVQKGRFKAEFKALRNTGKQG